ncbi:MAG: NUDIX domain-containing protein [Paracoccaceae bacterium]
MATARSGKKLRKQVAALPVRRTAKGKLRVLMVTSRGTGRWVVPKGWPMKGRKAWQAAAQEALEEAGAVGDISSSKLGSFRYRKRRSRRAPVTCEVALFPMHVNRLHKKWRERKERRRRWFSPRAAAKRVQEKELRKMLAGLTEEGLKKARIEFPSG